MLSRPASFANARPLNSIRPTTHVIVLLCAAVFAATSHAQLLLPNKTGRWSPWTTWTGPGIHMALLPGYQSPYQSKVIWWAGLDHHTTFYGGLMGWNPGNDSCATFPSTDFSALTFDFPEDDLVFCSSNSHLADGRLFAAGGTQPGSENGMRHSWIFDPISEQWTPADSMSRARW